MCVFVKSTCSFIVIDVDSVQLQVTVSMVGPCLVDPMFITDYLPKLQANNIDKLNHFITIQYKYLLVYSGFVNVVYKAHLEYFGEKKSLIYQ